MQYTIESLEKLDQLLADPRFNICRREGQTPLQAMAWHLITHNPFDINVLLKGTCAREDTIVCEPHWDDDDFTNQINAMYAPLFSLDNKELRAWLETTPLHDIAAWTAYIVRRVELDKIANYYDAAQDFYADSWYEWSDYEAGRLAAKDFVNVVIAKVDEVNAHIADGKQHGLSMDEIVLHDAMWGLLPQNIDDELAAIACDTLKTAIESLPSRPYIWSEAGKEKFASAMLKIAAEKLQAQGYDINYGKGYSIEQGYLLDYFSRLYYREAASKPED